MLGDDRNCETEKALVRVCYLTRLRLVHTGKVEVVHRSVCMCLTEYVLGVSACLVVDLAYNVDDLVDKLDPLVILVPEECAPDIVTTL